MIRRSERVSFMGGGGHPLAGIVDQPDAIPLANFVFTHCFTCNKDLKAIVRISRGLAAAGFRVLRYDLTGLGGSQGDFSHTHFTSNMADLRAACDFVANAYGSPDFLIGHSFGGACSLAAIEQPGGLRGAITLAAPSDTGHLADLLERKSAELRHNGTGIVSIGGREYTIRQQMLADFRQFDLPGKLRRVSRPVLLFHSPMDETLGFEHVLRLYGLLTQRGPSDPPPAPASLVCLPGADHLLTRHPADIEFITSVTAAWAIRVLRGHAI